MTRPLFIGTAGWTLPRAGAPGDVAVGTRLERYSRRLNAVEINSCFYRNHQARTYARWADSTPACFRFALKIPRTITHDARLAGRLDDLAHFLDDGAALGNKRGPLLLQLPPSLEFDRRVARRFLTELRRRHDGLVACEPRHPTWFTEAANRLLESHHIARVAADPPRGPGNEEPGGWTGLVYIRWHGSPRTYWSAYDRPSLEALACTLRRTARDAETWCIFDNTALGHALENAEELKSLL